MAKKPDDESVFFCECMACKMSGPLRATALQCVESARKAGWSVSADVVHCPRCAYRVLRLEKAWEQPPAIR